MPVITLPLARPGARGGGCSGPAPSLAEPLTPPRPSVVTALAGRDASPPGSGRAETGAILERHEAAVAALAEARARAEQAERRLRSRLVALSWPAALGGIAGGFMAVVALRLGGL